LLGPHTIALAYSDLAPLLLGDLNAEAMIQNGRLKPTTGRARQLAAALFAGAPWWRPPLDDLLA